jgi:hypothetical protein
VTTDDACSQSRLMPDERIVTRIVRALRAGQRESLTLAGSLGVPVAQVNAALAALHTRCAGCLELVQPYPDEPRLIVTVRDWRRLQGSVADEGSRTNRFTKTFR